MRGLDYVKHIVRVDEHIMKMLKELDELEAVVRHLEKYIYCDPYTDECIHGEGRYTKTIEAWLRLYECVLETEPEKIISYCLWGDYEKNIDYKEMVLKSICRKGSFHDCIDVNIKLPITKESKQVILDKIKEYVKEMMDNLPFYYAKTIMSIKEILEGIHQEIIEIRRNYEELRKRYHGLLEEVVRK